MLITKKSAAEKRKEFRAALKSGKLLRMPGAFSPLVAMAIQRHGFDGVYISGAARRGKGLPFIPGTRAGFRGRRRRAPRRDANAVGGRPTGYDSPDLLTPLTRID